MKPGVGQGAALIGWQTLLADLSLILFMVTAAAMAAKPDRVASLRNTARAANTACAPGLGEPLAVWRAGGSQTLGHWLAGEQRDGRQQLTISAQYLAGTEGEAMTAAQALVGQAGVVGQTARVILFPANADVGDLSASLAYDRSQASSAGGMARSLLC